MKTKTNKMKTKTKKWVYHTSHKFTEADSGEDVTLVTQLYKIGVYCIVNNNPSMQFGSSPSSLVKMEKRLNKQFINGEIKNLVFGREIAVTKDSDGFFAEI